MQFITKLFKSSKADNAFVALPWAKNLQGLEDVAAIEFTAQQLNNDTRNGLFTNEVYLNAFTAIDDKTYKIVEKISRHYIDIPNISLELEERMTQSAFLYHRQLFLIYLGFIELLHKKNEPQNQTVLRHLIARAMHNAIQMVRWRYYNYHSAPANIWLQMSSLYSIAEAQQLLNTPVEIYPDTVAITLNNMYVHACMLGSLESLSFKRSQIDLVHQLLVTWANKITIDSVFDEKKHLFYVDTGTNMPAKRIRNFTPTNSCRYWNFDSVNSKIELSVSAVELGIAPKQLGLDAFINHPYFLSTLEVLKSEWSRSDYKRQRRGEERVKMVKSATTAYGFEDVCYQIKQYDSLMVQRGEKTYSGSKTFEERLASHSVVKSRPDSNVIYVDLGAGYSNIIDESSKGIGLNISKQANEVSLGMLVGVTVKEQKNGTRLGVIRSIKPIAGGELQIGIEVVSRNAFCVETKNMSLGAVSARSVSNQSNNEVTNVNVRTFTAMLLPEDDLLAAKETLIIPRLQYNKNDVFSMTILGDEMLIKFTQILQRHDDWVRVVYEQQN